MAEEVKFSQEEMSQLTELQQTYATIQNTFGQLSVNRIRLEQELSSLGNPCFPCLSIGIPQGTQDYEPRLFS